MLRLPRSVATGIRVLLMVAGMVLLGLGTKATMDGLASSEWNAVTGSWVTGDSSQYRYRVADGEYTSERGRFGAIRAFSAVEPSQPGAGAAASEAAPNEPPLVFYDPSNPSRSVLERGPQTSALVFAGVGVLLLALSAFTLGKSRRPPAERSLRAEGLIPPTFQPSDPEEEQGWSGRDDLDAKRPHWR